MPPNREGTRMLESLRPGQPLPFHPEYGAWRKKWDFWSISYEGGPAYKSAVDSTGQPTFIEHELESPDGIKRRKRMATYRNYCRPICQKYNSFIFGYSIRRDSKMKPWVDWCADCDTFGTSLQEFMKSCSLQAEILGRYLILIDTTKIADLQTVAQSAAAGNAVFVAPVSPHRLVNWVCDPRDPTQLSEALVLFPAERCARFYSRDMIVRIDLKADQENVVQAINMPETHLYGRVPLVVMTALPQGQSLISDISELNLSLFNLDSILREELYKQTFTQFFAAGLNADDLKSATIGGRKLVCHTNKDIRIDRLTGDVSQAESIRTSMREDVGEIYRLAGLQTPDVVQNTESGRALKIRWNEVSLIASSIADRAEKAENEVAALWAIAAGQAKPQQSDYPEDFDTEEFAAELNSTLSMVDGTLPWTLKAEQIRLFASRRFPKMSNEQLATMEREIEEMGQQETERQMLSQQLREKQLEEPQPGDPNGQNAFQS